MTSSKLIAEKIIESRVAGKAGPSKIGGSHFLRSRMRRALIVAAPCVAVAAMACEPNAHEKTPTAAHSASVALVLGTTGSFAILAGTTVTSTGPTVVTGDLGVSPGTATTGFPPGLVNGGTILAGDAVALKAQSDTTTAYDALAAQPCTHDLTGQDLGGLTLTPGTYCFSSSSQLTGTLTLNGEGDPAASFIFQTGSTLTTGSNSSVRMINGGNPCNVYWQVGSSATLGTGTTFEGSILALTSITLTTGVSLSGRALARNGAVTMDTNVVSAAACQEALDGGKASGGGGATGTGGSGTAGTNNAGGNAGTPGGNGGSGSGGAAGASGALGAAGCGGSLAADSGGSAGTGAAGATAIGAGGATGGVVGSGGVPDVLDAGADAGKTICGFTCVELKTDPLNCGACGHVCGPSESCADGVCCQH